MPHTSPEASLLKIVGGFGSIFVADTGVYTGNFHAVQAVDDCLFSGLQATNMEHVNNWALLNKTLYAGMLLEADFTSVQLSTGCAMLYKH